MPEPPNNAGPVRDAHRFDTERLLRHLEAHLPGTTGPLDVRQFRGGQSNPTFWVAAGQKAYVLRKKPPGKLLPSAHAVEREYRVMKALADTEVPVPEVYLLCNDPEVIGTSFFVMEYLPGRLFWNVQLPDLTPGERTSMYADFVRILADLHRVDPEAVGLGDFGKVGGYVVRQVRRWSQQYEASRTDPCPPMEALMAWFPAHVPDNDETTLTHGDYRLDNLIFDPVLPRALAVVDWELSTLGHPLSDLAYTCMLYDVMLPRIGGLLGNDPVSSGIPSEDDFIQAYCARVGRGDVPNWPFFKAFSLFRLAAIAQGVYKRSIQGNASSEDAALYGSAVRLLSEIACSLVGVKPAHV